MRKHEVDMHSDNGYNPHPAVNVKVYAGLESVELPLSLGGVADPILDEQGLTVGVGPIRQVLTDAGFTHAWLREHLTDSQVMGWYEDCARQGFEQARDEARELFGSHVEVWSEGRSGGWLVVYHLPEVESWDAIMLNKWSRFSKLVREIADDTLRATLYSIYINVYEPTLADRDAALADLDVPDWRVATAAATALPFLQTELATTREDR